ncbi:hypothetical protein M0804_008149 [Polistes exclamans]|nr:hypothetical protein M0804_008149 [Polistes exclamans]
MITHFSNHQNNPISHALTFDRKRASFHFTTLTYTLKTLRAIRDNPKSKRIVDDSIANPCAWQQCFEPYVIVGSYFLRRQTDMRTNLGSHGHIKLKTQYL